MKMQIKPGVFSGEVNAPMSKSSGQRYLLMSLSQEQIQIEDLGNDADTQAVLAVLKQLPLKIEEKENQVSISSNWKLNKENIGTWKEEIEIEVGESGFALRSLLFLLPLYSKKVKIRLRKSLLNRDFSEMQELLSLLDLHYEKKDVYILISGKLSWQKVASLEILPEVSSSQYISGLLILIAHLSQWEIIDIEGLQWKFPSIPSMPYVLQTIAHLENTSLLHVEIKENAFYFKKMKAIKPVHVKVEKDWSGAAFLFAAAVKTNSEVIIHNLDVFTKQADKKILEALQEMGMHLSIEVDKITIRKTEKRNAFHIDLTDAPDLFPALAVIASTCEGSSVLEGIHRLRNKESDRALAIVESFTQLGINIMIQDDLMVIKGGECQGGIVHSYGDHRMAMALSILAAHGGNQIELDNFEVVSKSYPEFFTIMQQLGMQYSYVEE